MASDKCLQYFVRFVLSPAEARKVAKKLGKDSAISDADTDTELAKAVRQHCRLFLKVWAASQLVNLIAKARKSPNSINGTRIGAAVALTAATYRTVYTILDKLHHERLGLPHYSLAGPIIAGSLSSFAFGLLPNANVKGFIALYLGTKAVEWAYNWLDDLGYMDWKPRLFGAWSLFPLAMGQLFYTLITAPDCVPNVFKRLMLAFTGDLHPVKPCGYPVNDPWPTNDQWLSSFAEVARLGFPRFRSPVVYSVTEALPASLLPVEPVLSGANPANTTLTGALLHPTSASDFQPFLSTVSKNFAVSAKWLLPLYLLVNALRARKTNSLSNPDFAWSALASTARTAVFVAMTTASAWGGIGLSQSLLPARSLPATRFRLVGFLSGLWSFVDQVNGRPRYLYATRLALMSQYNLIRKSTGRAIFGPDAEVLFAAAMAATFIMFNRAPEAIASPGIRKVCSWVQTGKWHDPAAIEDNTAQTEVGDEKPT